MFRIPPSEFLPNRRVGVRPEPREVIGDLNRPPIRGQDLQHNGNPPPRDGRSRRDAEKIADSGRPSRRLSSPPGETNGSSRTKWETSRRHAFYEVELGPFEPGANDLQRPPRSRKIRQPMPMTDDLRSKHLQVIRLEWRDSFIWEPGRNVLDSSDKRINILCPSRDRGISAFDGSK